MANCSRGRSAYPTWTDHEANTLLSLLPSASWPEISAALPGRTRGAIWQFARKVLHVRRVVDKRDKWTNPEIAMLQLLYPASERAQIEAMLPGRKWSSIQRKAGDLGISRKREASRNNERSVHPIILQLRNEREGRRLSRKVLGRSIGYAEGNMLGWELGKTKPGLFHVCDWAEALGFELVLKKKERVADTIVPWPEKRQMMAGR